MAMARDSPSIEITVPKSKICWTSYGIYLSHALTAWGDRLWMFAVGLYLAILFEDSFQYAAIYGLSISICVIIGGPYVGTWVDKTSRLKAATYAIVLQNVAVALCAVILILLIQYSEEISEAWNGHLRIVFLVIVIIFAVVGELASVASKIAIVKDWIVVLADNDEAKLAKMNSIMRTIDLTTSILAPAVVAQIIAFISRAAGAGFIAVWNIVSGGFEIYLLHQIFKSMPKLGEKHPSINLPTINVTEASPNSIASPAHDVKSATPRTPTNFISGGLAVPGKQELIPTPRGVSLGLPATNFTEIKLTPLAKWTPGATTPSPQSAMESPRVDNSAVEKLVKDDESTSFYKRWHWQLFDSLEGWKDYFNQRVRWAGVGLALLYMTVLGFDSITIGYMYSQGLNESYIGIISAAGALSGILGSLSFPFLRRRFGKCSVGNFGFGFQLSCLILCVISVFVPGSPFLWLENNEPKSRSSTTEKNDMDDYEEWSSTVSFKKVDDLTSVIIFATGITLSRFGLWIADLSVTQLFQEEIPESQRGIINGVQNSMNQIMDLLKFMLVIILPSPPTFGYLIILSWTFVFLGWVLFMVHTCTWRRRMKKIRDSNL